MPIEKTFFFLNNFKISTDFIIFKSIKRVSFKSDFLSEIMMGLSL